MFRRFTDRETAGVKVVRRADKPAMIEGYAAVFYSASNPGTEYRMWDDMLERIMPGAFDRAISERHDARGLFNHDSSSLLGRAAAGTLRLSVDAKGLRYEIDVPDTQVGRDTVTSIERGDLSGSSFAFVPHRVTWVEDGRTLIRQVEDVTLYDVGPVTFPAYEATTTATRSGEHEALQRELEQWRRDHFDESEAISVRLRQIALDETLVNCD